MHAQAPAAEQQQEFQIEIPNNYGYFSSAAEASKKRREAAGYQTLNGFTADEQAARYAKLCAKHPEAQRCQPDYVSPLVTKPATQSMINGSMVRSDGIILVPGNLEDLKTWALDPQMSGDTLGLLLPTLFVIVGAQLKQTAGVPEWQGSSRFSYPVVTFIFT